MSKTVNVLLALTLIPTALIGAGVAIGLGSVALPAANAAFGKSMAGLDKAVNPAAHVRVIEPAAEKSPMTFDVELPRVHGSTKAMQALADNFQALTSVPCKHVDAWEASGLWLAMCDQNIARGFILDTKGNITEHGSFGDVLYRVFGKWSAFAYNTKSGNVTFKIDAHLN